MVATYNFGSVYLLWILSFNRSRKILYFQKLVTFFIWMVVYSPVV